MIVYNERGHRIEDDSIDIYPEDDFSSQNNTPRNNANGYSTSRSHTPVDTYHPPSSSNSRRTSNAVIPDVTRTDTRTIEVSKGYTPSIAPSARSATYRGSDGERTGSDSERRKGKGSYVEDRDRGMPGGLSPIERTTSNGLIPPPISKVSSTRSAIGGGEILSSNKNSLPASASRSPSIKPQSRTQSIYGGDGDHNSAHDIQQSQPVVDEQGHLWDNPAPPISPRSAALDAILDRPKSGLGVHSRSHTPFSGSRPRTPITHEPPVSAHIGTTPGIARSNTPFIDRPKSGIEGSFFDRPKSAFGSGSIYGDSGPAMFGDSGPAANIGSGIEASLFGDPPAFVFGDAHVGESGVNDWGTTGGEAMHDWGATGGEEVNDNGAGAGWGGAGHEDGGALGGATEGGADDNWSTPVAEEPVVTTPTARKEKNKRKNSNAVSAPASGVASRASPALSTKKSPFENTTDMGFYDDPAAGTRSITPIIQGSGLLGSKAPSPLPLSPLNPASQMINDPSATGQEEFNWGTTGDAATNGEIANDLNNATQADNHTRPPTRVPSPIPPVPVEEPVVVEKETVVTGKGKKKKKGSGATTPAKSPHALTQEAAEKEEKERIRVEKAEQERLATEAADRLAVEAAKLQAEQEQEAKERAEKERLAEAEKLANEEAARLQKEQAEEKERLAEAEKLANEEAARLQEEQAKEKERLAEAERLAEEAARLQEEKEKAEKDEAERERLEQERKAQEKAEQENLEKERAEHERLEQERIAQEEKDKAAAAPVSAFGSDPPTLFSGGLFSLSSLNPPDKPWMSDTGGGDDSWGTGGIGWGSSTKKKKTKLGAKSSASASPWGTNAVGTPTATTPLAEDSQAAAGLFSFSSTTPNLEFGFDDLGLKSKSRPASPVPTPVEDPAPTPENEPNSTDVVSPTAENDAVGEEEAFEVTVTSKKKKKKGKGAIADLAADTPKEEPSPLETPGVGDESPVVDTPAETTEKTGGAGKKKKKGKK